MNLHASKQSLSVLKKGSGVDTAISLL